MAGGQGGRPPGRRDNPYAPRKRRPPTDEEKKRKDEKSAATRARTRERKDAAKLAQAAEAAAQRANKRANFFNPRGPKSRQSTKARSSPDARPSDVVGVPGNDGLAGWHSLIYWLPVVVHQGKFYGRYPARFARIVTSHRSGSTLLALLCIGGCIGVVPVAASVAAAEASGERGLAGGVADSRRWQQTPSATCCIRGCVSSSPSGDE